MFIVLFRENPEGDLLHSWCSPVGWLDSGASPEGDTWSLCVLLSFRRAKLGREAVEYGASVPVTLPHGMDDGSTQNASSTPTTGILSLLKEGMSRPPVPPQSDHTVTALLMHHKAKASADKKYGC